MCPALLSQPAPLLWLTLGAMRLFHEWIVLYRISSLIRVLICIPEMLAKDQLGARAVVLKWSSHDANTDQLYSTCTVKKTRPRCTASAICLWKGGLFENLYVWQSSALVSSVAKVLPGGQLFVLSSAGTFHSDLGYKGKWIPQEQAWPPRQHVYFNLEMGRSTLLQPRCTSLKSLHCTAHDSSETHEQTGSAHPLCQCINGPWLPPGTNPSCRFQWDD